MTSKFLSCFVAVFLTITLSAVLAGATTVGGQSLRHHYKFIDLGTFGGPTSRNDGIYPAVNNEGTVIVMTPAHQTCSIRTLTH